MSKIVLNKFDLEKEIIANVTEYTVTTEYEQPVWSWYGKESVSVSSSNQIKFFHELTLTWTTNSISMNDNKAGTDFIILPEPPNGQRYVLQEDRRKICSKCKKKSEYYIIAPYGSKYDDEPICVECLDK